MVKCPHCSTEMLESNRFCSSCGSALTPKPNSEMGETMAMSGPPASTPRTSTGGSARTPMRELDEGRFLAGTVVAERYRIIALLGRGGMGEVYRATDLTLGQQVALKFLPEALASDPDMLARFYNEVRIARQVSHPNVCRVYDIGEADGHPYISMEYVDGENLSTLLRRIGRLPHDTAVEMARKLCAGLAAAHGKGVLHRDLKPANIMIDSSGQVLVMDFGLAGIASQIQGAEIRHGTPAYMAPEQLSGAEVTVRSDIYALGLVLYEMFTGKRAFEAATLAELTKLREESAPPSLVSMVRELDPAVERVVQRCLERDPRNRPPSALAVAAGLPGGDPLQAALAAGETPSPELVAAASDKEALRPMMALACLAVILVCLACLPFLRSQTAWIAKTPMEGSPETLAQKARDFARRFGYTTKPVDTAWGLHYVDDYVQDLARHGKSMSTLPRIATGQPAPYRLWYRASPQYMLAGNFGNEGIVTADDPALDLSGMVEVEVDPEGRLVSFNAAPPQVDKTPASNTPIDGQALLSAAGLDPTRFKTAEPQWAPLAGFDQRAAWTGTYPGDANPLRVEAASWRGKLVYFALISPWTRPERMEKAENPLNQRILVVVFLTVLCVVVIGACLVAYHNIRTGRADWRSAFRLAGFLLLLGLASWAFAAHHMPSIGEIFIFVMGLGQNAMASALIWVLYVALEPYVRRRWPQTIISWTRVLGGRLRDPVVGGHALVGVLFGAVTILVAACLEFVSFRSTGVPSQLVQLNLIQSSGGIASALFGLLPKSILGTLGIFFVLFIFRLIFRKEWLMAAVFVVFFTGVGSLATPEIALIIAPLRLLQNAFLVYIMLRFGLLSFVIGECVATALVIFPITSDFSTWYGGSAIFMLACVLLLSAYAFYTALGGRPLFKTGFLDE